MAGEHFGGFVLYQSHSKKVRIVACLVLIGGIVFAETHHKLPVFRLLTFIQVFLASAVTTSLCRGRLQSALLVVTTIVFGLVLTEAAGNWVISRQGAVVTARDQIPAAAEPLPSHGDEASAEPNSSGKGDIHSVTPADFKAKVAFSPAAPPASAAAAPSSGQASPSGARQDLVDANLFSPTPGVGWRLARAGQFHVVKTDPATGETIYDVRYTIDDSLDRTTVSADSGQAIVFLGDSFTFGSGVDDSQTMAQRLADLSGRKRRVVNLGVPGYSPAQVLYQLRTGTRADVIGPKPAALIMLTGPYHASRIACKDTFTKHAPRFVRAGGKIAYEGPCFTGLALMWREFIDNCASYNAFVAPLTRNATQANLDLYVDIVAEVSATAERMYGVKPLVPYVHFYEATHDAVLAKLRDRGVDVIDMTFKRGLSNGKSTIIPGDGHPTAYAHDLRAKMIKDALERRGVSLASAVDLH